MEKLKQIQADLDRLPKTDPELLRQADEYKAQYLKDSIRLIVAEISNKDRE